VLAPSAEATFPGPNGKIAFQRGGNIWIMNPSGTGQVRLTWSGRAANPQWSADGRKIAYDQDSASTGRDIWVMKGNGSGKYRVTTHPKNESDPAWSPDGRWLAFVSDRRDRGEIFKVRATVPFGTAIRLTTTAGSGEPETTGDDPYLSDSEPNWSPLGNRIAFRRYMRFDDVSWFSFGNALMTMNTNGAGIIEASTGGYGATCPSWGPGGNRIAWADDEWYYLGGAGASNVWHSNPDGSAMVAVTRFGYDTPWRLGCVTWSPYRGVQIAFSGVIDDGNAPIPAVYRVIASGSSAPTLIAGNGANPDWGRAPA
jgi:Tol biopolymer transport system component